MADFLEYDAFLPQVTQYVNNAPAFICLEAIKNAVIEFCMRTQYYKISRTIPVIAGQKTITLDVPEQTKIANLYQVYLDQYLLIPANQDQLSNIYRLGSWEQLEGSPQYYTRLDESTIRPVPYPTTVPATGSNLYFTAVLTPTRDSTGVDGDIYEYWAEVIGYGARARIFRQAKQPYYDIALATEVRRIFKYEMDKVIMQLNKGLSRASPQVEFQRWV